LKCTEFKHHSLVFQLRLVISTLPFQWAFSTKKATQQQFEGKDCVSCQKKINTTRMSVVVNLWVSIAKYQTLTCMKWSKSISKLYTHKYTELPHTYKFNQTWKELEVWPDDI
jgi:hypothetical protein